MLLKFRIIKAIILQRTRVQSNKGLINMTIKEIITRVKKMEITSKLKTRDSIMKIATTREFKMIEWASIIKSQLNHNIKNKCKRSRKAKAVIEKSKIKDICSRM